MFDQEELEILEALENNTLQRSVNAEEEIALAKKAAKEQLQKSKNITLRLNMLDLKAIKVKSKEVGIPYQTLIGALVHQYVDGKVKLTQGITQVGLALPNVKSQLTTNVGWCIYAHLPQRKQIKNILSQHIKYLTGGHALC